MAFQFVIKNTFWQLEMSLEESEFTVQRHRQRAYSDSDMPAYTDMSLECSSTFKSADLGSFKSTDLGSPVSTVMGSSIASSNGSVAGDASDRWADMSDSDDDMPTASFSSTCSSPPSRPQGTWFSPPSPPSRPAGTWFLPAPQSTTSQVATKQAKVATEQSTPAHDHRTTLIVKNLPEGCSHKELGMILDEVGLAGLYNFIYIPFDFKKSSLLRYGFVNLEKNEHAVKAMAVLNGFSGWDSEKSCEVDWGSCQHGLHANIERYRNSPLMHDSVPDEYKPVLFRRGVRIAFPAPTKALKPMKIRKVQQS